MIPVAHSSSNSILSTEGFPTTFFFPVHHCQLTTHFRYSSSVTLYSALSRSFGSHLCQTISLIALSEACPPFIAVLQPPLRVDCCFTKPESTIGIARAGCLLKVSSSFMSIKCSFIPPSSFHLVDFLKKGLRTSVSDCTRHSYQSPCSLFFHVILFLFAC